jgi:histidinol phosphatase-like PHP family hydrolase
MPDVKGTFSFTFYYNYFIYSARKKDIMKRISVIILVLLSMAGCRNSSTFPITDLHIHLKGGFTIDDAVAKSKAENIKYGIVTNCGIGFPVHNDSQIDSVIQSFKDYPQFLLGLQAEGREWVNTFSKESRDKFDYVFTDGMTFTDAKGRRNRIWIKEETWIDNEQEFMDYLVNTIVKILSTEPINIYVNPTFLPDQMSARYDSFWTGERMDKVIKAAKDNNIAIEINNRYKIPSIAFISRAKKEGVRFTVGTNNMNKDFSGAAYALEAIKKCNLTQNDFYQPVNKRQDGKL